MKDKEPKDPEGTIDALTNEKGILDVLALAYLRQSEPAYHRYLTLIVFVVSAVIGWFIPARPLFDLTIHLSLSGVTFSGAAVGLVLAAFSLYVSFLDRDIRAELSREVDAESGLSYLKVNTLPFVKFACVFIVYFIACLVCSALSSIEGLLVEWYQSGKGGTLLRILGVLVMSTVITTTTYAVLQIKSLVYNLYHQAMVFSGAARVLGDPNR